MLESSSRDLERLQRWERSGALWQVVQRRAGVATIALCTCDGGEEVDRFTSRDPLLLAYISGDGSAV